MTKNIVLLIILTWMSLSHAKTQVAPESTQDSESYRVEKPVKDGEVKRDVAGGKMKKKVAPDVEQAPTEDSDSEVRYWQFQE
jgi:hypothetical protein